MIDHNIFKMADNVDALAATVNHYRPLPGSRDNPLKEASGPDSVGRDLAVARTYLQTAALWLRKAADSHRDHE